MLYETTTELNFENLRQMLVAERAVALAALPHSSSQKIVALIPRPCLVDALAGACVCIYSRLRVFYNVRGYLCIFT